MEGPLPAGAAFDDFLRETAPASRDRRLWKPADGAMPSLYLSHGAPPLFDDRGWIEQLFAWAQALPRPTAILIVSAHWESAPLRLCATPRRPALPPAPPPPARQRPLGLAPPQPVGQRPRPPAGLRLRRLRPPLLRDD